MTTVAQVVKRSMRNIGVIQANEAPENSEAVNATEQLNSMLHAWEHDGIKLNHVDLEYTDTIPYPADHVDPIMYNLAARMGVEYGVTLKPEIAALAESGYRALQNYYLETPDLAMPDSLDSRWSLNGDGW